jgi:predicted dienelactone hydrolase
VRTLDFVNADQVDILRVTADPNARYDRHLTVEIWYPARLAEGTIERTTYQETFGIVNDPTRPLIPFTFDGRAVRDAESDHSDAPYPLILCSHGYPGSRLMFTYLTENLASKGYVVASIDHTESTFRDSAEHASSMLHRPLDTLFVLEQIAQMSAPDSGSFLAGLVDPERTGLIGFSMGGYGTLLAIGAGLSSLITGVAVPNGHLKCFEHGCEDYLALRDVRIKAAALFAPYGGDLTFSGFPGVSFWEAAALECIDIPTFWVAGTLDDISMYGGVRKLFGWARQSERYLLTYENARHNVAPNPPPQVAEISAGDFARYTEYSWDTRRINNINQHFMTAFMGLHLKYEDTARYLNQPVENASEGSYHWNEQGYAVADDTHWIGFLPRTAIGLRLERRRRGESLFAYA